MGHEFGDGRPEFQVGAPVSYLCDVLEQDPVFRHARLA